MKTCQWWWGWWDTPLIPAQEAGARLVYRVSCRTARTTEKPFLQSTAHTLTHRDSDTHARTHDYAMLSTILQPPTRAPGPSLLPQYTYPTLLTANITILRSLNRLCTGHKLAASPSGFHNIKARAQVSVYKSKSTVLGNWLQSDCTVR